MQLKHGLINYFLKCSVSAFLKNVSVAYVSISMVMIYKTTLGMVLYGNNNNRIRVQINGSGCALARKGWNEQLYKFLKTQAKNPKLNRVDIAFDDFESEFVSVQACDAVGYRWRIL